MPGKNIVLVGMPGAGKSTVGYWLARKLGKSFIDTDGLIRKREGMALQGIIDRKGMGGFLKIEESVILSLKSENCVIATGGSVIYSEPAVSHLKRIGKVFYLKFPCGEIEKRICNFSSRGIVIRKGQKLADLYEERAVLYEKCADAIIDGSGATAKEIASKIAEIAD